MPEDGHVSVQHAVWTMRWVMCSNTNTGINMLQNFIDKAENKHKVTKESLKQNAEI
jgi:hypothetical protein